MSISAWELSESTPWETATTLIPANESLSYRFKASASFRVSRDVSSIKMQSNGGAGPVAAASNLCRRALSVLPYFGRPGCKRCQFSVLGSNRRSLGGFYSHCATPV
jgi:hypothetical protein